MQLEEFKARIGGSVKRRHKNDKNWREYEVLNENYATYYFNLQQYGFEYEL